MKRNMKRILTGAVLVAVLSLGTSFQTLAGRIAFSDPSTTTGETVNVNMKVTATGDETIGRADVTLSYDSSMLEFVSGEGVSGGAGTLKVTGSSNSTNAKELAFVLTFRALRPGSASITIADQEVYDSDSQLVNIEREGSSAITIAAAEGDSTNANLAGLQISPGTLTPAFAKDVLEYTVTVGGDVDSLVVDAPAVDSGASVSVSGNESLQIGVNTVVCTVTAQDGQTVKTYTIKVTKVEGSADGTETDTSAEEGVVLRTPERSVTVYPVTDGVPIPDGFVLAQVSIDGHDVQGWIWGGDANAEPQYCVFYATNENGDSDFYRYDLTEKTIQRYFRDPLVDAASDAEYAALVDNYNSLLSDYNMRFYIIIGLIVLAVILLIVIIALVATRGGSKDDFYEKQRQDGGSYPERHNSNRQSQGGSAQADRRRMSREERYMRGLEEEEEAAEKEEAFRAEQQIRERQAQRNQVRPQGQPQRQAGTMQGQRSGVPQGSQRMGQSAGQRPAGAGQTQQRTARPAGSAGGQRPAGSPQGQRQAAQPGRGPVSEDQNYVVRGPVAGDEESAGMPGGRNNRAAEQPQGGDDDFQIIDID